MYGYVMRLYSVWVCDEGDTQRKACVRSYSVWVCDEEDDAINIDHYITIILPLSTLNIKYVSEIVIIQYHPPISHFPKIHLSFYL